MIIYDSSGSYLGNISGRYKQSKSIDGHLFVLDYWHEFYTTIPLLDAPFEVAMPKLESFSSGDFEFKFSGGDLVDDSCACDIELFLEDGVGGPVISLFALEDMYWFHDAYVNGTEDATRFEKIRAYLVKFYDLPPDSTLFDDQFLMEFYEHVLELGGEIRFPFGCDDLSL